MTGRPVPPGGDALTRAAPPWWFVRTGPDAAERVATRGRATGLEVHVLVGERMRTAQGLFAEYARAWRLPDYFGHNWSALEDCLTDLSWVPAEGYLTVVARAGQVLRDEPDEVLGLFLDLLTRVGRAWSTPVAAGEPWDRPELAFHTVLATRGAAGARRLLARAGTGGADISSGAPPEPG